jgi:hypothetical protein
MLCKRAYRAWAAVLWAAVLTAAAPLHAETRGKPYSEEYLVENCQRIFVGEVLATKAFPASQRTVPSRVRVLLSIKGSVPAGALEVTPKDPGSFVYFDEEFDPAEKGKVGVFFVGTKGFPNLLMKYKEIPRPE